MSKVLIVILLNVLVVVLSFAQSIDIPDKIEKLNKAGTTGDLNCNDCEANQNYSRFLDPVDKPRNYFEECIESLCPSGDSSYQQMLDNVYDNTKAKDVEFDKEIAPLILKGTHAAAKLIIESIDQTLAWLKTNPEIKDEKNIRLFNLFDSMYSIYSMDFDLKETSDGVAVDEKAAREKFPALSEKEFNRKVSIVNILMNNYLNNKNRIEDSDPGALRIIYPDGQLKKKIDDLRVGMRARREKVAQSDEFKDLLKLSTMNEIIDDSVFDRVFINGEINSEAIEGIGANEFMLSAFELVLKNKKFKTLLSGPVISIMDYVAENDIEKALSDRRNYAESVMSVGNEKIYETCKAVYATAKEFLPTQRQIDEFKKREPEIKNKFYKSVEGVFSAHSYSLMKPKMDKWFFTYPITKEAFNINFKMALEKEVKDSELSKQNQDKDLRSPGKETVLFMNLMMSSAIDIEDNRISIACEDFMPSTLPDASYSATGGATVGLLPLKDKNAEGIVYHELAHLLFGEMEKKGLSQKTKKWFDKSKSCLGKGHLDPATADAPKENIYLEEDWADMISAHTTKQGSNFMCIFNQNANENGFTLVNSDGEDDHSSDFYRLLHIARVQNESLPAACVEGLKLKNETPNFSNCITGSEDKIKSRGESK
jgi:hypothetical protein